MGDLILIAFYDNLENISTLLIKVKQRNCYVYFV